MTRGTLDELQRLLRDIDGRGYGAYKRIAGSWRRGRLTLHVDHVQGDPFAQPSRLRLEIAPEAHGIPTDLWETPVRRTALRDVLLRVFARGVHEQLGGRRSGSGRSGLVSVDAGGAEILERSGCDIGPRGLQIRFRVGLPARGRSVLGRAAAELLCSALPEAARIVTWSRLDHGAVRRHVDLADDHAHLQAILPERGLVAFVRDGSILPRASGVSSRPLPDAVPFESPESLRVTLPTRHHGEVHGMGVPRGITLVTGGGFHGKTTLLEALQAGIYPHVPGDGREWVVTDPRAVKVRSEDGRAVTSVDISAFVRHLPGERSPARFTTEDASGSTSLAAAIAEAIEVKASTLLLDEDTCATNLLVRDARMQALVHREALVPLIDRARELYERHGVSLVMVAGGLGDYLDVADRVLLMEAYRCKDVTEEARALAQRMPTGRQREPDLPPLRRTVRVPLRSSFDPRRKGRGRGKVRARGLRELRFGEESIELDAIEQLVDDSQVRAIGVLLERMGTSSPEEEPDLASWAARAVEEARREGLYALAPLPELAMVRDIELAAAIGRLRSLRLKEPKADEA